MNSIMIKYNFQLTNNLYNIKKKILKRKLKITWNWKNQMFKAKYPLIKENKM